MRVLLLYQIKEIKKKRWIVLQNDKWTEEFYFSMANKMNSITKVSALAMHSVYSNIYFHSSVAVVATETVTDDISCVATITCGAVVTVSRDGCNKKKILIFLQTFLEIFKSKRNYFQFIIFHDIENSINSF